MTMNSGAVGTDDGLLRRRRQIAARYRKQGYRVIAPSTSTALPAFLGGFRPDLIVERDNDHVVVEVKRSRSLKGTNELTELAERVASVPGWRLELVVMPSGDEPGDEPGETPGREWLARMLAPGSDVARHGVYLVEVMAWLIRRIATAHRVSRAGEKTTGSLASELAYKGVIDQGLLDRIDQALTWRNSLMHGSPASYVVQDMAEDVEELCRDLNDKLHAPGG